MAHLLPFAALAAAAEPPSIDEPLRTGAVAAADAAVVIGVEDYAFVPDVPYARRDAEAVRQWLLYARGVPTRQVEVLTDASREQVLAALDRAKGRVGPEGTLWVYWAGHGAAAPDSGRRLLLGVDVMADETVFAARAIAVDEVRERLDGTAAVLWLDTCYSGVTREGEALLPGKRLAVPAWASPPGPRALVWTAADQGQLSSAFDTAQHGLFTYLSVGALRGWADGELDGAPDGEVTAAEAQAYVLRALAVVGEHGQTPVLEGGRDDWVLSRASEPGPDLAGAVAPGAGTASPGGGGSLQSELEALRARQDARRGEEAEAARRREAAIDEAARPVRQEARQAWREVEGILAGGGEEGELALRRFVEAYGSASVTVGGEPVPVEIGEVAQATAALASYDSAEDVRRERAARARQRLGLVVGLGAGAALGISAGARALYVGASPTGGDPRGLYVVNQVSGFAGYGLGAAAGALVVSGAFR
jgi:hypothetical protein